MPRFTSLTVAVAAMMLLGITASAAQADPSSHASSMDRAQIAQSAPIDAQQLPAVLVPVPDHLVPLPNWHNDPVEYSLHVLESLQASARAIGQPFTQVKLAVYRANQRVLCIGGFWPQIALNTCGNVIIIRPDYASVGATALSANGLLGWLMEEFTEVTTGPDLNECLTGHLARAMYFQGLFSAEQVVQEQWNLWHYLIYRWGATHYNCTEAQATAPEFSLQLWFGLSTP